MPSPESVKPVAEGFAVPPDPGQAGNLDDLVERLRRLKIWAGDPSYERITDRINKEWTAAGRPAGELARRTTVADCFRPGRRRINTDLVTAVVHALHPDVGYLAQWQQALRVVGGEIHAAAQVRVQDSLPHDLPEFTGRTLQLDQLRQVLSGPAVCAIVGMAGVGKTQLAIHAAHLWMRDQTFDRVLWVNLRGFHPDPAQPPADPGAVLDGFLRLLGVPGQQIPHDLPARAAVYRARLAGTRVLVVLDNAADAAQVAPLLPDTPGCLALVTSRLSLTELPAAAHLSLEVFHPEEAVAFLTRAVPQVPVGADSFAAHRIAARCGRLPLALGLLAGHIRATPGWTLTDHADRLDERHHARRLDTGVELALDLSYQHLPAGRRRLLRLAALHPGQDFDAYAAAALTDTDLPTVQDHLERLHHDHLLQETATGRYGMHDLVRAYAAHRAGEEDPPAQRRAALTRLFDYYVAGTATAVNVVYPHQSPHATAITPVSTPMPHLDDQKPADSWLDTELPNLLASALHATQHGWSEHVWRLSAVLEWHLRVRGRNRTAEALHRQAVEAARHRGDRPVEMNALNRLGYVDRLLGRHERSGEHHEHALRIARDIGDRDGELMALAGLGSVHRLLGRHEPAIDHYEQALRIAQAVGHIEGQLTVHLGLGALQRMLGRWQRAGDHYEQALRISRDQGNTTGALAAVSGLGDVHRMLGHHETASDHYEQALHLARDVGARYGGKQALFGLGALYLTRREFAQAAECYQRLLEMAREDDNRNWQFEALQGLGRVHHATGRADLALTHHEQALRYATDLAQPTDQARAHDGLAHTHHALGRPDEARRHWQRALDILTDFGTDHTEDVEATVPRIRAHLIDLDRLHPPAP